MRKYCYVLSALLMGWLSYWMFPIKEPALLYFLGAIIGVLALFYLPREEYTHNILYQSVIWVVLILLFPVYIVAGLTIGVATHIALDCVLDYAKQFKLQFGFYSRLICTFSLILVNAGVVVSVVLNKFINY